MRKEIKFGYGFLFAGAAFPILIDKLFGSIPALVIAAATLLLGAVFLAAGHFHKGNHETRKARTMAATIGMFALIGAVSGATIGALSGAIWKIYQKNPGASASALKADESTQPPEQVPPDGQLSRDTAQPSEGGRGGSAKVVGDGIAIGGPGGHAGTRGRGGDGGSAEVHGHGIAAGGEGGSADSDTLWRPPAKSGYEVTQEALNRPIDSKMRQYGRGGMSAGYLLRYDIVAKIRSQYFADNHKTPETALENVNAVPLQYVNDKLSESGVNWRARIVRGLDYEFYVPERSSR